MLIPYVVVEEGPVIIEYVDPPEACMNMELNFAFGLILQLQIIKVVTFRA